MNINGCLVESRDTSCKLPPEFGRTIFTQRYTQINRSVRLHTFQAWTVHVPRKTNQYSEVSFFGKECWRP